MPPIVETQGLWKRYCTDLRLSRRYGLSDVAGELRPRRSPPLPQLRRDEFWALREVSFTLEAGEALGVVGNNGAGKTTLLRILHGLTAPDGGTVKIGGRSGALIELGTAFDELATGREAIAVEAAVLGLSPDRVRELEAEIIDFAELAEVIDAPVRTYSLGMRMRLGYAIAAHVRPELLLVDEVLAVGDVVFQRKCISYIHRHLEAGGSLVLVAHDMWQIRAVCSQCLVLDKGEVVDRGDVQASLHSYMDRNATARKQEVEAHPEEPLVVDVIGCRLENLDGGIAVTGLAGVLVLEVDNAGPALNVRCLVAIGPLDLPAFAYAHASPEEETLRLPPGRSAVTCLIDKIGLAANSYAVSATLVSAADSTVVGILDRRTAPSTVAIEAPAGIDHTPYRMIGSVAVLESLWLGGGGTTAQEPAPTDQLASGDRSIGRI